MPDTMPETSPETSPDTGAFVCAQAAHGTDPIGTFDAAMTANAARARPARKPKRSKADIEAEKAAIIERRAKRKAAQAAQAPWNAAASLCGPPGRWGLDTVTCSMYRDAPCWLIATDGKSLGRFVVDDYEAVKPNEPERYIDGAQYRDGERVTDARPMPPIAELFSGASHAGWTAPAVYSVEHLGRAVEAARLAGATAIRFGLPVRDSASSPVRLDLFNESRRVRLGPVKDSGAVGTIILMPMDVR